jgi:phage-related baseplate assembly protein
VRKQVTRDDIRVLTDTITVIGCNIIAIDSHSRIGIRNPSVIEQAKKQFIKKFESTKRLGWNVTKSWIIANLFIEGVENVELIEPKEDIVIMGDECAEIDCQIGGNIRPETYFSTWRNSDSTTSMRVTGSARFKV